MLEDIIKEIELEIMQNKEIGRKQVEGMCKAIKIIQPHLNEEPKCGDCSRRKWYQKGFEDGKKSVNSRSNVFEKIAEEIEDYGKYQDELHVVGENCDNFIPVNKVKEFIQSHTNKENS